MLESVSEALRLAVRARSVCAPLLARRGRAPLLRIILALLVAHRLGRAFSA